MSTHKEVAEWMYEELKRDGQLSLRQAIAGITAQFGKEFTRSGNAINRHVLAEFRRLTKGTAVWERGNHLWRLVS